MLTAFNNDSYYIIYVKCENLFKHVQSNVTIASNY